MTLTEYTKTFHTNLANIARGWGISHQTLRRYALYCRGLRGRDSSARRPSIAMMKLLEEKSKGQIRVEDWPPENPNEETP